MGAIVGGTVYALCLLLGVRYSLSLAALAFFCEFMPMIGPTLMVAAAALAGFIDSLRLALLAPALYLLLRTGAVYVLGPRIISQAVGIHPIAAVLGLAIGAKLFGVWGCCALRPRSALSP
jgi:predicted PurR-regulated permease PerM